MCATRFLRISAANIGPNRFHQNRTVSWLMSIPRSARRSSTLRSDSGYLTYNHHDQTDDLWRAVEISERVAHRPSLPRAEASSAFCLTLPARGHPSGRDDVREIPAVAAQR